MSANLKKTSKDDCDRVDLTDPFQTHYWTQELGCSIAQLRAAVEEVGYAADDVRRHLARQHSGLCRKQYHFYGR